MDDDIARYYEGVFNIPVMSKGEVHRGAARTGRTLQVLHLEWWLLTDGRGLQ